MDMTTFETVMIVINVITICILLIENNNRS